MGERRSRMGDGGHRSTHRAGSRGVDGLVWVRAMSERAEAVFVGVWSASSCQCASMRWAVLGGSVVGV